MKEGPRQAAHSSKLAEIAVITMGQSPPGETYNTEQTGLPFFQGKADFGEVYPTPTKWCSSPNRIAEPGDILLSVRAPVGPINIAKERCCIGRGLASIRPRSGKTITPHLRYFFLRFESEISRRGVGTTFAAINRDDIERLLVPMTSIENQRRIAEILDQADALRRKRRESLALTSSLIPSIFHSMFGDPATNPKGWPRKRIGEIGTVITGNTPPRSNPAYYGTAIEWIKSDNINTPHYYLTRAEEGLSEAGKAVARTAPAGSILVTCIAGSPACIGNAAMADREVAFNQRINALVPEHGNPDFLYAHFLVGKRLVQQASTAGMKGLVSKSRFEAIVLIFPPLTLQREFAACLAEVRALEDKQRASLLHLDSLFHSLLHEAFASAPPTA